MIRRISSGLVSVVFVVLVAAALVRANHRRRVEPFLNLTRVYLERALVGDSIGMRVLATDDSAVGSTLALARHAPDRLRVALRTINVRGGRRDSVEAVVFFHTAVDWCAGAAGGTDLQATFYHVDGTWKVHQVGLGPC